MTDQTPTTDTVNGKEIRIRKIQTAPDFFETMMKTEGQSQRSEMSGKGIIEPCSICGKGCRTHWTKGINLFTIDGSQAIHPDDVAWVTENLDGWVGMVRIGTECRKDWKGWTVTRKS